MCTCGPTGLRDRCPRGIGDLPSLRSLNASENQLGGALPPELGRLERLRTLRLGLNDFSGVIPVEWAELRRLEDVYLRGNRIEGELPAWIGEFAALRRLNLSENLFVGHVPEGWGELRSIETLNVSFNPGLWGPLPLSLTRLDALSRFYVGETNLCLPRSEEFRAWYESIENRTPNAAVCVPLTDDRAVLVALYEATGGPEWHRRENWLSDLPLSAWEGVEVDDEGYVTDLILPRNNLVGPLPNSVSRLSKLERVWLFENELTGPIPSDLGNLGELVTLSMGDNSWTGAIPPELGRLARLETLHLQRAGVSGPIPPELGQLANLKYLWLFSNDLSGGIPPELGNLAQLSELSVGYNPLTGPIPPELGRLGRLETLHIMGTGVSGPLPPELGNLSNLRHLWLFSNDLSGGVPPWLGNLTHLSTLWIGDNPLTGPIPPEIGGATGLAEFSVQSTGVSGRLPAELCAIPSLRSIGLAATRLEGLIPRACLARALQDLDYYNTGMCAQVDDAFDAWLGTIAEHRGTDCSDAEVERMALEEMYDGTGGASWVDGSNWTSALPVADWHGVRTGAGGRVTALELPGNGVDGPLPPSLANFEALEVLDLTDNALRGSLPEEVALLADLRELRLGGNAELSGALPFALTALRGLEVLHMAGSGLCASPASSFQTWWRGIADRRGTLCGRAAEVALSASAYLTQSVQDSAGRVPLVAGRRALLRVFVTADRADAFYEPRVVAEFTRDGRTVHTVDMTRAGDLIPTRADESRLSASFNAEIPGSVIEPGAGLVLTIDPDGVVPPAPGSVTRVPASGATDLAVIRMPDMELTVVPVLQATEPDSTISGVDGRHRTGERPSGAAAERLPGRRVQRSQ